MRRNVRFWLWLTRVTAVDIVYHAAFAIGNRIEGGSW